MVSRDANELMTLPARSSNRGYDCARRRTPTTPRVTWENRPATTENYKTISGRGAAEVAEYGSDPGGDPTDRHRRGWLASPDERKLQNNFDTGAGESRGDGVETTAPLTASGWAGAARLSARGRGRRPTLPLYRTARGLTGRSGLGARLRRALRWSGSSWSSSPSGSEDAGSGAALRRSANHVARRDRLIGRR